MKMTACCGFGHRDVLENIEDAVYTAVLKVAELGCEIFYTGAMGAFDSLFSSAVRKAKKTYPGIKLIFLAVQHLVGLQLVVIGLTHGNGTVGEGGSDGGSYRGKAAVRAFGSVNLNAVNTLKSVPGHLD